MAGFVRMCCGRPADASERLTDAQRDAARALGQPQLQGAAEALRWLREQLVVAPHKLGGLVTVAWASTAAATAAAAPPPPLAAQALATRDGLRACLPAGCALVRVGEVAAEEAGLLGAGGGRGPPLLDGLRGLLRMLASQHSASVVLVAAPPLSLRELVHSALGEGSPPTARQRGHASRTNGSKRSVGQ